MTTDPHMLSPEDIALAGEYVLGTLPGPERVDVARRIAQDRGFALEVARWEARLDPLAAEVQPVAPPAQAWAAIEQRLFAPPTPAVRRGAGLWGWLGGASVLASALLAAVFWLGQPVPQAPGPMWISDMVSQDGAVRLAALYDEKSGEMRVSMGGAAPAEGRDFELWLIDDQSVVSLGVMPREGGAAMPIPEELRARVLQATLAITDEPLGGAPQGVATGPLVASAPMRRI